MDTHALIAGESCKLAKTRIIFNKMLKIKITEKSKLPLEPVGMEVGDLRVLRQVVVSGVPEHPSDELREALSVLTCLTCGRLVHTLPAKEDS